MLALELYRSKVRYVAARAVGGRVPGTLAGAGAPLRLVNRDQPRPPTDGWARVRPLLSGICGSDLATLSGSSSLYFTPLVSLPFTPGHEVVGELLDDVAPGLRAGDRVVLDPVLSCQPRGLEPCHWCRVGQTSRCDRVTVGDLAAGLQTGYCADTGGGWGQVLLAHRDQLHAVGDDLADETAVLAEPLACAVHTVRRARPSAGDAVLLVGAGTVGLLTLLALRELTPAGDVTVVAKHPRQRELAYALGATDVVAPDRAPTALRRARRAFLLRPEAGGDYLLGGVDLAIDCAGSRGSLDLALRTTRAGGRVVLSGIPPAGVDLTPLWYRELDLVGAYASRRGAGGEATDPEAEAQDPDVAAGTEADLATALRLLGGAAPLLAELVSATYPLDRWREALDHAFGAGKLGAFKIAFAPQSQELG